jgi:uncharacterized membrane protein YuzA (DUF378 family)
MQPTLHLISGLLVILGALNWGLVGAFDYDLAAALFGSQTALARSAYGLIGLAGLHQALIAFIQDKR